MSNNYVADFETTTDPADCRVWSWAMCDAESFSMSYGLTIEEFVTHVSSLTGHVYFHNLAFDGTFILDFLFRAGYRHVSDGAALRRGEFSTLISMMGKFYSIKVHFHNGHRIEFRDSLKKLPMTAAAVSKAFQLDVAKGSIDYDKPRPVGYEPTDEEWEYVRDDVLIIAKAMKLQLEQGMTRLTVGSDSLYEFKQLIGAKVFDRMFPVLPITMDADIRSAYRGGYTYARHDRRRVILGPGDTYDVNSLYPSVMYHYPMPYGKPEFFENTPPAKGLWIMSITFTAKLKPGKLPCIQIKGSAMFSGAEYLHEIKDPVTLSCTNIDFELWNDHYDMDILVYNGGWQFQSAMGIFHSYIDKWMEVKANSVGGLRTLSKLHLNSLYGKFATNPDITPKIPVMEDNAVALKIGAEDSRNPVYTAVGVFVTAYARDVTIRAAQEHYETFVYADTDSLHLLEGPRSLNVHPTELGAWKHEGHWDKGMFIRAKCYSERFGDEFVTHIAGCPERIAEKITFADMVDGREFHGKLVPHRVAGGVVLQETTYTLNF
jgi:hypothetical protein